MNKLIQLSLFFLFSAICSNAQETIKTSVFFESGKASLSKTATNELQKLVNQSAKHYDFDLDIKAYSDDVGSANHNRELARKRAKAVADYIKELGLEASSQKIDGMGEIALSGSRNIEQQRNYNRRVDISLSPFTPSNLNEFYGYFEKRYIQKFHVRYREEQPTTIMGEKGSILHIPKDALQLADGSSLDGKTVVIQMQEAYTFQDMIFQNLTTTSGGEMLQTGGMVYIEAKTTDGKEVMVNPKSRLQLTMPSSKKLPKGMQLFTADRQKGNNTSNIDWQPESSPRRFRSLNRLGSSRNGLKFSSPEFIKKDIPSEIGLSEKVDTSKLNPKGLGIRNPQSIKPPVLTVKPPEKKSWEWADLVAENERRDRESKKDYKQRIERLQRKVQSTYERDLKIYDRKLGEYNSKLEAYSKDSLAKLDEIKQYQQEVQAYEARLMEQEKQADLIREWIKGQEEELKEWGMNFDHFSSLLDRRSFQAYTYAYNTLKQELSDDLNYIRQQAQILRVPEMLDSVNLALDEMEMLRKAYGQMNQMVEDAQKEGYPPRFAYGQRLTKGGFEDDSKTGKFMYEDEFTDLEKAEDKKIISIYQKYERAKGALGKKFMKLIKLYLKLAEDTVVRGGTDRLADKIERLRWEIIRIKSERDWFPKFPKQQQEEYNNFSRSEKVEFWQEFLQKQQKQYENIIGINKLGWINCDVFVGEVGNRITFSLNLPEVDLLQTQFYVCFPKLNAMLPSSIDKISKTASALGVPQNSSVVVIGLMTSDGKMQLSKTEGKVSDLHQQMIAPFEPCKLKDLKTLF